MKKLSLLIVFTAFSFMAVAQKGTWYIGGTAGFNSSTDKSPGGFKTVTSSWSFAPEAGTFLKDDIQLGIALGISGSSQKDDTNDLNKSTSFSPTVYGRKFFKITDNFSTFAGLYVNYTSGTTTDYFPSTFETTDSGFGIRLGVGIAYALSPRFTAVGQYGVLGYQSVSYKTNGTDAGSTSSFGFGVNTVGTGSVFNIGLYYTFVTR